VAAGLPAIAAIPLSDGRFPRRELVTQIRNPLVAKNRQMEVLNSVFDMH